MTMEHLVEQELAGESKALRGNLKLLGSPVSVQVHKSPITTKKHVTQSPTVHSENKFLKPVWHILPKCFLSRESTVYKSQVEAGTVWAFNFNVSRSSLNGKYASSAKAGIINSLTGSVSGGARMCWHKPRRISPLQQRMSHTNFRGKKRTTVSSAYDIHRYFSSNEHTKMAI
jgi:hypothetical protein